VLLFQFKFYWLQQNIVLHILQLFAHRAIIWAINKLEQGVDPMWVVLLSPYYPYKGLIKGIKIKGVVGSSFLRSFRPQEPLEKCWGVVQAFLSSFRPNVGRGKAKSSMLVETNIELSTFLKC